MEPVESVGDFVRRKEKQFKTNGRLIKMEDIGRKGRFYFKREAWTFLPQGDLDKKVFVFERLRRDVHDGVLAYPEAWEKGEIEYRIGYFIVGRTGKRKGKWVWGQYCPLIPHKDLLRLLKKARAKKVLLD